MHSRTISTSSSINGPSYYMADSPVSDEPHGIEMAYGAAASSSESFLLSSSPLSSSFSSSLALLIMTRSFSPRDYAVIEEDDEVLRNSHGGLARLFCVPALVISLMIILLCAVSAVILWKGSPSYSPEISVESITFEDLHFQVGPDRTGVPTYIGMLNATVKLSIQNTASSGVYVTSTPFDLDFYGFKLATGNMENFYQSKKSHRILDVAVSADRVPLYGAGPQLVKSVKESLGSLRLSFMVKSRTYLLGGLLRPTFKNNIQCAIALIAEMQYTPFSLKDSCQYS